MDTYLEIAEQVLRTAKRPMSAKGILNAAYISGIMPDQLYGKDQHKTLQARLSEDILKRRNSSKFYRTDPGMFFLYALLSDETIPEKYKQPFSARRRTRDLHKSPALAFKIDFFNSYDFSKCHNWADLVRKAESCDALKYVEASSRQDDYVFVWSFSLVLRSHFALSYRIGRYRDDRDHFANKRTIGFPGLVTIDNQTLFTVSDYGVSECALEAILTDLDLSRESLSAIDDVNPKVSDVIVVESDDAQPVILLVMKWTCPDWFEPATRRLSLNDLRWMDMDHKPNNIQDFDDWSAAAIDALVHAKAKAPW